LTRTHLQDLIETTAQIHYEAFRSKQLLAFEGGGAAEAGDEPVDLMAVDLIPTLVLFFLGW